MAHQRPRLSLLVGALVTCSAVWGQEELPLPPDQTAPSTEFAQWATGGLIALLVLVIIARVILGATTRGEEEG